MFKHLLALFYFLNFVSGFSSISIDKSTKNFIDDKGRTVIFHGVNVVYKLAPFIPILDKFDPFFSLSEEDVTLMKKFGFNLVRLGLTWESVERSEGEYDYEHLEKIEKIINLLGNNGIYVLLDAHQDMFSRIFCGEGVPEFYARRLAYETECKTNMLSRLLRMVGGCLPLSTFNWRYDDQGIPLIEDCKTGFLKFHQSPELTTIYSSFYKNEHGIQDKFADFWKVVARKFKDNSYIIGYDLWNEPWPGDLWSDVRSMWPGNSDHNQVLPFYQKLDREIRTVHPEFVSFFEPVPFPDTLPFFGGKVVGHFTETPAGKDLLHKQVLNFHSYCCQAAGDICATGEPSLKDSQTVCPHYHKIKVKAHSESARKLGVPLIVTEFGACSHSEACYNEMKGFVEAAEENLVSWAYWMYKPYGDHTTTAYEHTEGIFLDNGVPQEFKIKALTRPYIQAYQGVPLNASFDPETSYFKSRFVFDVAIDAPTVLYFNGEVFYKYGHDFKITDEEGKDVDYSVEDSNEVNYFAFRIKDKFVNEKPVLTVELISRQNKNYEQ